MLPNYDVNIIQSAIAKICIGKKKSQTLTENENREIVAILQSVNESLTKEDFLVVGFFLGGLLYQIFDDFDEDNKKTNKEDKKNQQKILLKNILKIFTNFKQGQQLEKQLSKKELVLKISTILFQQKENSQHQNIFYKILEGHDLNLSESEEIGIILFEDEGDKTDKNRDGNRQELFRGFLLSYLRIRYETETELKGIFNVLQKSTQKLKNSFSKKILFAEPMNGFTHCFFVSPLLAHHFQQKGYSCFHWIGNNPGPKKGVNLLQFVEKMNLSKNQQNLYFSDYGYFIHQKDFCSSLSKWTEKRKKIVKRPCLSLLEKMVDPIEADIFISSVYHSPYYNKIKVIAQHHGYPYIVIQKLGLEGGIGINHQRKTKFIACKKQNNEYLEKEFTFEPESYFENFKPQIKNQKSVEPLPENEFIENNLSLMKDFIEKKSLANESLKNEDLANKEINFEVKKQFQQRADGSIFVFDKIFEWFFDE